MVALVLYSSCDINEEREEVATFLGLTLFLCLYSQALNVRLHLPLPRGVVRLVCALWGLRWF